MALSYLIGRRNGQNTPWNKECDALLVQLWSEGYSASQIVDRLGSDVTRNAVIGRVHRLNLPPRKVAQRGNSVPKPPAPPPKPPAPRPPTPAPGMRGLRLVELKGSSCRFPIDEGTGFLFCGADATKGQVYCPFHTRLARRGQK